jgi:hypothetical protein
MIAVATSLPCRNRFWPQQAIVSQGRPRALLLLVRRGRADPQRNQRSKDGPHQADST